MNNSSQMKIIILLAFLVTSVLFSKNNTTVFEYNLPKNKQGIADRNINALSDKRYSVFKNDLSVGIQKYNYYWRNAENSSVSSKKPQVCKKRYVLFPKNEKQKELLGISNYHCYNKGFINSWKKRFQQNTDYDIQVAVVLWTTPKMYQNKECEGFYFPLQKKHLTGGCYPAAKHYDDYEDWIRFTAYTFGKYIDHYIVWNEVSSTNWADSSTGKYTKDTMLKNLRFQMNRSFDIYSTLLEKTMISVNALDKQCLNYDGACKNLVYLSLTHDWYSKNIKIRSDKKDQINIARTIPKINIIILPFLYTLYIFSLS